VLSSLVEENSLRPNLRVRDIDPFVGSLDMATTNRIHEGESGYEELDTVCQIPFIPGSGFLAKPDSIKHGDW
jgi:hypothetical protein